MKRQQHGLNNTPSPGGVPFAENLIFWAPLTENSIDIIGGKVATGGTIGYSNDGAQFSTSDGRYLGYKLTEAELRSVKTIYCELIKTTSKYTTLTCYSLQTNRAATEDGSVRNYVDIWHNLICMASKLDAGSGRVTYDDASNTSVSLNTTHKVISGVYQSGPVMFFDGVKVYNKSYTDKFWNYVMTPYELANCYIYRRKIT